MQKEKTLLLAKEKWASLKLSTADPLNPSLLLKIIMHFVYLRHHQIKQKLSHLFGRFVMFVGYCFSVIVLGKVVYYSTNIAIAIVRPLHWN